MRLQKNQSGGQSAWFKIFESIKVTFSTKTNKINYLQLHILPFTFATRGSNFETSNRYSDTNLENPKEEIISRKWNDRKTPNMQVSLSLQNNHKMLIQYSLINDIKSAHMEFYGLFRRKQIKKVCSRWTREECRQLCTEKNMYNLPIATLLDHRYKQVHKVWMSFPA